MRDIAAVRAAICFCWSNGQTEGQITKLKLVKRQMYGRGKLDLLEARLIGARWWPASPNARQSQYSASNSQSAATNAANYALVTAWLSIRKPSRSTRWPVPPRHSRHRHPSGTARQGSQPSASARQPRQENLRSLPFRDFATLPRATQAQQPPYCPSKLRCHEDGIASLQLSQISISQGRDGL